MRVTNSIQNRQYHRNMNNNLESMLKSMNKIMTQKAYTRVSENTINATKAMATRRQLSNLAMYEDNLKTANEVFEMAETNLRAVNSKYVNTVVPKLEQACNDTYSPNERNVIALELEQTADFMMTLMNSDFAERQLFGGTSNGATPFTYEMCKLEASDGSLIYDSGDKKVVCYNGIPVNVDCTRAPYDTLISDNYTATYTKDDGSTTSTTLKLNFDEAVANKNNSLLFPGSSSIFVDVGMGIKYDDDYNVDPQTAMDIALNGAKLTGCGMDDDGDSLNLIQLIYDAADALKNNDAVTANKFIDKICTANGLVLTGITVLGAKQNSVEFYLDKNSDYEYSLMERQNDVEGVDLESEISHMESTDAAYQAALQLSARVLSKSIFDFI